MRHPVGLIVAGVVLTALVGAQAEEATWVSLFDGKTLTGWQEVGGGKWSVQNGCIVGERGDGRYGWLCTDKTYANFILELKLKTEAPGNSGVQFRSHVIDGEMKGWQGDLAPEQGGETGSVYEEGGTRGWLARAGPEGKAAFKPGEWNTYQIRAIENRIETRINGVTCVTLEDERAVSGIVALQVHSGDTPVRVLWKDIRILDLGYGKPGDPEAGWQPLFNGKDLSGWVNYGQERFTVEGGDIVGEAVTQAYGYLGTEKTFTDFEARCRFRAEGEGNSGLFFHSTIQGVDITGVQAEIDPHVGTHTAGLYEAGGRGWIAMPTADAEKLLDPKGWNDLRVICKGNHTITYLNGLKAVDFTDDQPKYTDGIIALQLHSGGGAKVRWGDIYVREDGR